MFFLASVVLVLLAAGYGAAYVVSALHGLPSLGAADASAAQTSFIYDLQGKMIEPVPGATNRVPIGSIAEVPLDVQHAFIAKEDSRFYQNPYGIDIRAILRAAVTDLVQHRPAQGASTIPQQVARGRFPIGTADTLKRKLQEAVLAFELTRHYTKDEILTMYLNEDYFGQGAWGIQAASQTYFGVPVGKLTLGQGAMLAGLVRAPSVYDPYAHPQLALQQRNIVLDLMLQQGYITAAQNTAAKAQTLQQMNLQSSRPAQDYLYPFYVDAVVAQLQQHFTDQQIYTGGLHIYTALNTTVQQAAENAMHTVLDKAFPLSATPHMESAAVVMDQNNGDVEAIVGGREHTSTLGFNRATSAQRQPGSSMKPLAVYVPALESGLTPATVIDDAPKAYPDNGKLWIPTNDNTEWDGLTTLREALRRSVNEVAVRVLDKIGIMRGYQSAVRLGLTDLTPKDQNLSLALGGTTDCCTPLEMARAYSTIANGGYRVDPQIVLKVTDAAGNVLFQSTPTRTPVLSPQVAYVMTNMLESVVEPQPDGGWIANWGTAPDAAVPNWPTAGKTGTTSLDKDAWFVGFTPALTAAIWAGYDTPQAMNQVWGGAYGAPIFRAIMEAALKGQTPTDFSKPNGIVTAPIDAKSGDLPGPLTPAAWVRNEIFVQGTQPTTTSSVWVQRQVDSANPALLWDPTCGAPPVTKVFLNRPPVTLADVASMAAQLGLAPSKLIPTDMALAPPLQTCSGAPQSPTASATASAAATGSASATPGVCPPVNPGQTQICAITLGENRPIEPSVIQGVVGAPIQLAITATSGSHRLIIRALNVDVTLQAGQSVTLLRTPTQVGTFPVFDAMTPGGEGAVLVVSKAGGG
ncbi:MAG TPA: PBP1A family penicillin-binding protein [Bacillota bacterium]|nr:PBP1A family penicillin-binding protein [Bacillota bacterium]